MLKLMFNICICIYIVLKMLSRESQTKKTKTKSDQRRHFEYGFEHGGVVGTSSLLVSNQFSTLCKIINIPLQPTVESDTKIGERDFTACGVR